MLVGAVDQLAAVRAEGVGSVGHRALVGRDQARLAARLKVDQIDVAVGAGVGLVDGQPASVGRHSRDEHARVLEHEPALIGDRIIGVEVEDLRVADVRGHPEGVPGGVPAQQVGLDVLAWRQVADGPVQLPDIDVLQFTAAAAAVGRQQDTAVAGEIAEAAGRHRGRCTERNGRAAGDGQGPGVEHAGLVAADQDRLTVGREAQARGAGHAVVAGLEEFSGRIGAQGRGACRDRFRRGRLGHDGRRGGHEGEDGDETDGRAHGGSLQDDDHG